ncbi:hypothetical protein M8J76_017136 [Diaphorina citri]|nr:hypothetical protein M8J76_017136 [Diaphorina citri]
MRPRSLETPELQTRQSLAICQAKCSRLISWLNGLRYALGNILGIPEIQTWSYQLKQIVVGPIFWLNGLWNALGNI